MSADRDSARRPVPWRDPGNRAAIALKRRVAGLLRSKPVAGAVSTLTRGVVRSHGLRIDTRSPEIASATRAALFFRTYESAELRLLQHLAPTMNVVDLGASLGVVSSAAASRMPKGASITCVEANASVLALAELNVRTNAPQVNVWPIHGAVDYSTEEGAPVTFARGRLHVASSKSDQASDDGFTAPAVRLSSVAPQEPFTLIMDIEGAEAGLLHDEAETLSRCTQMLVELHRTRHEDRMLEVPDLLRLAISRGFRVAASYGNSFVLVRE